MFSKRRPPSKSENEFDQADDFVEMTEEEAMTDELAEPVWEQAEHQQEEEDDGLEGLVRPQQARKSSSLSSVLPIATAAVVGVVALGLVYVNFVAPAAAPGNTQDPAAVTAEVQAPTGEEPAITPMAIPGTGAEGAEGTNVPDGALTLSPEPVVEPTAPALEDLPTAITSPLTGEPVTETATPEPAPVAVTPEVAPAKVVAPAPEKTTEKAPVVETAKAAPVVAAPVTEAAPVSAEPKVDTTAMATADLSVRLEAMEKRLDQVSAAADKAPAAEQSAIQALDQDMRSLKTDLDKLSKRLQALESRPAPVAAAPVAAAPVAAKSEEAKPASPTPAAKVVIEPAPKPAATISKPTATAKPAAPAVTWSLRAAQPGEAWVSEGQSKELRKVAVGDTLTGVGKIQQIRQVDGRWEIIGSQATIRQ